MRKLILASTSPRRKMLLEKIGIPFTVEASEYEENMQQQKPGETLVKELSLGKAEAVAQKHPGEDVVVLAADTFVIFRNRFLGKERDYEKAKKILEELSGTSHEILTGFAIVDCLTGKKFTECVYSRVHFKRLSEKDIKTYLDKGTYRDKAGAYGIQEVTAFIEKVEGDYDSIVGLPVEAVVIALKAFGLTK